MPELNSPLSIRDGRLFIEDCDTVQLAERFGTPLFVVSQDRIVQNFRAYRDAFQKHWPEGRLRVMGAIKANPITAVRRLLTQEGCGCDTFGAGELELALRGGVPHDDIAVNGSIKSPAIIRKAIELGIHVILDSPVELDYCQQEAARLGKRAQVLIRVKPWLGDLEAPSDFFPNRQIRDMTQTVKYGIPNSEMLAMLPRFADTPNVEAVGVHVHIGRHTKKLEIWDHIMRCYADTIKQISDGLGGGWTPRIVSLGGGFASEHDIESRVAVTDYETPTVEQYAETMCGAFRDQMHHHGLSTDGLLLEVEPGRALHNESGIHLTRIHVVKHETENLDRKWAETDTSECFLSVGSLNVTPPFQYVVANRADEDATQDVDIAGITCNYECLAEQAPLPDVEPGDVIAFLNTGSYIEVYTCNFNALPRPGTVIVNGDKADWIKRPETLDEVFARDVTPDWLS